MENDVQKTIKSIQVSFGQTAEVLKNVKPIIPDFSGFNSHLPHMASPLEKIDRLCKLNEEANETNSRISESLKKSQIEIESLKSELKQIKESHKYDFLKNALIAFSSSTVGAIIGAVLTILITSKSG